MGGVLHWRIHRRARQKMRFMDVDETTRVKEYLERGLTPAMRQFQGLDQQLRSRTDRKDTQPKVSPISTYRVGELYHEGHKNWREGTHFTYSPSGLKLTLFHRDISKDMIADVQRGPAEFAMIVEHPLIVLGYRFGNSISWNDVPYCWHLQPSGRRVIPALDPSPEARVLLWVSLIGTNDGIIHAQRGLTFSPTFTSILHHALRRQAMTSFIPEDCTSAISRLYLNNSTIIDRLSLAVVRTAGNE
jgi:hypothetical protein